MQKVNVKTDKKKISKFFLNKKINKINRKNTAIKQFSNMFIVHLVS